MKKGLKHYYSNNDRIESKYNDKKIVLNNKNDLINIPIQQLRTAQLKNFCGKLFDQLYKEAMVIEHNQDLKNFAKSFSRNITDNNLKTKSGSFKIPRKNGKKEIGVEINKNQKIKPGTGGKKVVIKIINKKVKPKKLLHESDPNVKLPPQLFNNTIIYKNIPIKKYMTENYTEPNSSPCYYRMNMNIGDNNIIVNKIIFSIKYDTSFGEEVGVLGSIEKLGNWDQSGIFYLNWNRGNIWTGEIEMNSNPLIDFEFKFVISSNRYVKRWENGNNNKVNFDKLVNEIKYKKNGFFDKYEYRYDSAKGQLYLKCKWD